MCYNLGMSKKLKRIIAIIALVAMGIFSVSFVMFLLDKEMFNGSIGLFALFFGALGISLWFVLYLSRDKYEEIMNELDENANENANANETQSDMSNNNVASDFSEDSQPTMLPKFRTNEKKVDIQNDDTN